LDLAGQDYKKIQQKTSLQALTHPALLAISRDALHRDTGNSPYLNAKFPLVLKFIIT
jgi:hypothetical protein